MKTLCPDEETLADYIEHLLPESKRRWVALHLIECDACLDEYGLAKGMVRGGAAPETDPAPAEVTHSAVRLVSRQVSIKGSSLEERTGRYLKELHARVRHYFGQTALAQPGLAPIRGRNRAVSKDLFHIKKGFREFETDIEIEKTGENMAQLRIRLSGHKGHRDNIRVTLKTGERELCSSLPNKGQVLFEDITFGSYTLLFTKNGSSLGAYPFEIKESRNGSK